MQLVITQDELAQHRETLDQSITESLAEGLRALADPHRLRILHLLLRCGEMCACETMLALDMPQSNLSFHMKTLRHASLVKARKSGRWMYYSLNRPAFEQLLGVVGEIFNLKRWPERPPTNSCDQMKGSECD